MGEKFASVSTVHPPRFILQPPSTSTNARQRQQLYAAPACRNKVLHGVQGLDQGRVKGGGKRDNVYSTCRGDYHTAPKIDTSMWPARH